MWIAISGRIPEDDEDSCYIYEGISVAKAKARFGKDIYADTGLGKEEMAENTSEFGESVFINTILVSESEIKVEYQKY